MTIATIPTTVRTGSSLAAFTTAGFPPMGSADRRASERLFLEQLHSRVCAGDDRAVNDAAELLLSRATHIVKTRRRDVDPSTREQAVLDAVAAYLLSPDKFHPTQSSLLTWIVLAAIRNIDDESRKQRARTAAEMASLAEVTPTVRSDALRHRPGIKSILQQARLNRAERKFLLARLRKRPWAELVEILGLEQVSEVDQKQQVHRFEERLRLRLKRAAARLARSGANNHRRGC